MSITVTPIPRPTNPNLLVQSGTIAMWSGLIANIPDGWFLCDGTNSTPDLRNRFIKGAADAVEAGATGGAATHTHAGHDAHATLGTHQHRTNSAVGSGSIFLMDTNNPFGMGANITPTYKATTAVETNPQGAQLTEAISGGTPDAHSAHNTPNSEPPYYVALYIMKS